MEKLVTSDLLNIANIDVEQDEEISENDQESTIIKLDEEPSPPVQRTKQPQRSQGLKELTSYPSVRKYLKVDKTNEKLVSRDTVNKNKFKEALTQM